MIRLDGDGNMEELNIASDALKPHMVNGGPTGYMHGTGSEMMGSRMGFYVGTVRSVAPAHGDGLAKKKTSATQGVLSGSAVRI